eukprot:305727_1
MTMFIDANGVDFDECGQNKLNSCGTIGFATALIYHHPSYINIDETTLYVSGQNSTEINSWMSRNKDSQNISFFNKLHLLYLNSPCVFYTKSAKSTIIIFDNDKIKSMESWFPNVCKQGKYLWDELFHITSSVTFYNLIINDIAITDSSFMRNKLFYLTKGSSLFLYNCSFYNIVQTNSRSVIRAPTATIHNTTFHNITYNGQLSNGYSFFDITREESSFTTSLSIDMDSCIVNNFIGFTSFIVFHGQNFRSNIRSINIFNLIFG